MITCTKMWCGLLLRTIYIDNRKNFAFLSVHNRCQWIDGPWFRNPGECSTITILSLSNNRWPGIQFNIHRCSEYFNTWSRFPAITRFWPGNEKN